MAVATNADNSQIYGPTYLTSTYDSIQKKITITFPEGVTNFLITVANPCDNWCFFPPTVSPIDSTFDFNTGTLEYLEHDQTINQSHGWLKMTNGSKMNICSTYCLINKDSITMLGEHDSANAKRPYANCTVDNVAATVFPYGYARDASKRSVIIVNDQAALILDNGSKTYVGANASIIVRAGGTLLVKDGALLEIGSKDNPGYGEVIAEPGSYVCIESDADIRFYGDSLDSTDKNIFFASFKGSGVTAGTNSTGANGRFNPPMGEYSMTNCLALCSLKIYNNYGAIANPKYGWSNINTPKACFTVRDTFCYGDTIYINGECTLNETRFKIEVCEWDTNSKECHLPITTFPSAWDTGVLNYCILTGKAPFVAQHNYRIRLIVANDCGDTSDSSKVIYVKLPPTATFTIPDSACPGVGTVTANGSGSTDGYGHIWTVRQIPMFSSKPVDDNDSMHEANFESTGTVSSSFTFPGYRFKGGYKYEIVLTILDRCGSATKIDTIWIPLQAEIQGPDSVTVNGHSCGSDSVLV